MQSSFAPTGNIPNASDTDASTSNDQGPRRQTDHIMAEEDANDSIRSVSPTNSDDSNIAPTMAVCSRYTATERHRTFPELQAMERSDQSKVIKARIAWRCKFRKCMENGLTATLWDWATDPRTRPEDAEFLSQILDTRIAKTNNLDEDRDFTFLAVTTQSNNRDSASPSGLDIRVRRHRRHHFGSSAFSKSLPLILFVTVSAPEGLDESHQWLWEPRIYAAEGNETDTYHPGVSAWDFFHSERSSKDPAVASSSLAAESSSLTREESKKAAREHCRAIVNMYNAKPQRPFTYYVSDRDFTDPSLQDGTPIRQQIARESSDESDFIEELMDWQDESASDTNHQI